MTLEEFGLTAKLLVAGFAGGLVNAFVFRQTKPTSVVGSIVAGTLTANYLGEVANHYIGIWVGELGSAFIVGLSAMVICQGILATMQRGKQIAVERGKNE